MKTIYIIAAKAAYGGDTKFIRAFESKEEAEAAVELIKKCDPRRELGIEEFDFVPATGSTLKPLQPQWDFRAPVVTPGVAVISK